MVPQGVKLRPILPVCGQPGMESALAKAEGLVAEAKAVRNQAHCLLATVVSAWLFFFFSTTSAWVGLCEAALAMLGG